MLINNLSNIHDVKLKNEIRFVNFKKRNSRFTTKKRNKKKITMRAVTSHTISIKHETLILIQHQFFNNENI